MYTRGHNVPHQLLSHSPSQTLRDTCSHTVSHSTPTRTLGPPPRSLGPSIIPPGDPKLSFPLGAPRAIPKLFRYERRWDSSPGFPGPGAGPPRPAPRAAPPLTSPGPQQLAGLTACGASTGAAAPASSRGRCGVLLGGTPSGGGAKVCPTATPATGSLRPPRQGQSRCEGGTFSPGGPGRGSEESLTGRSGQNPALPAKERARPVGRRRG